MHSPPWPARARAKPADALRQDEPYPAWAAAISNGYARRGEGALSAIRAPQHALALALVPGGVGVLERNGLLDDRAQLRVAHALHQIAKMVLRRELGQREG